MYFQYFFLLLFVIVVNCQDYETSDYKEYEGYDAEYGNPVVSYKAPASPVDTNALCPEYSELSEASRHALSDGGLECDVGLFSGNIWYRFVPPAGSQMSEQPISPKHCGKLKIFAKLYLFQIFAIALNFFQ